MKVLLIEDDPLMIRLYEKIFRRKGYEVDIAERGMVGLTKAAEGKPNLILLDIMMPEMDGFEVLAKLVADPATKSIPVIVLTNLAGEEDEKRALDMGAVRYVVKSEHNPDEIAGFAEEILRNTKNV